MIPGPPPPLIGPEPERQEPTPGERDAGKVREAFPPAPKPVPGKKRSHHRKRGRPGRPPAPRPVGEPSAAVEEEPAELTPEEREFWARQVQSFFASIAAVRGKHWEMPDGVADAAGEPAGLTARKYLPGVMEDRPELVLAGVIAPFILGALRVEYDAYQTRAAARRGQRGGLRPEGVREDLPEPAFDGAPILPARPDS